MSNLLLNKVVNGIKWTTLATVTKAVLQIGYISIMARLLDPKVYGLFAMAGVLLRFGTYFASMGLGQALIQKKELSQENIRSAFTSSFLLGLLFFITMYFLAPYSTFILDNEQIVPVIKVMGATFLINGCFTTSNNLLRREMKFFTISIIMIITYVISYCVIGIYLGYNGFGVWSLVIAALTQELLNGLANYFIVKHNIIPLFKWKHYKPLFSFGSRISVISFLQFISSNLDKLLIGKVLTSTLLGLYDRAFTIINLPAYYLTNSLSKILFPSFSKIQSDIKRLAKAYSTFITLLAALLFPICFGIFAASEQVVLVILGEKWTDAIPILQILCLAIPLSFTTMFAGIICDATARLNEKMVVTFIYILIICTLFFFLKKYGVIGFAVALVIGESIKAILYFGLMNKILKINLKEILISYLPGVINGILIGAIILGVTQLSLFFKWNAIYTLIAQVLSGGIFLIVFTFFINLKLLSSRIHYILTRIDLDQNKKFGRIINGYLNYLSKRI